MSRNGVDGSGQRYSRIDLLTCGFCRSTMPLPAPVLSMAWKRSGVRFPSAPPAKALVRVGFPASKPYLRGSVGGGLGGGLRARMWPAATTRSWAIARVRPRLRVLGVGSTTPAHNPHAATWSAMSSSASSAHSGRAEHPLQTSSFHRSGAGSAWASTSRRTRHRARRGPRQSRAGSCGSD